MSVSGNINLERSLYYGVIVMTLCYGLEIYMYIHSVRLLMKSTRKIRQQRRLYVIVGSISLLLTGIVVFTNAVFMEFMWIEHRDFEDGPLGYLAANSSIWWQTLGTAANQVTNFVGDGLLLYRCYIIWNGARWVIIFPGLIYLASIAMAIVTLVQSSHPGSNFFRGAPVDFGVPWAALSVALNIVVTVLITYKLLTAHHRLKKVLPDHAVRMYTGMSAIFIESALPFSILGIAFAVTYGLHSDIGPAFLFVWATFCALSPQLIIFRISSGQSWTRDLVQDATANYTTAGGDHLLSSDAHGHVLRPIRDSESVA
ncbi:hypothetical protein CPC08DRAFT_713833 [Agrocybe pediades]|nr:hypothetical protein CPC08DRAFT_713833 [Agrocybe pediades]